ncbi:hypothetical protein BT96DRAFT_1101665 [Gymnopus androsaceus JB14]|uniref:Mid2 domain-containing protein n=1 Tax=Gymnopus androsaceus JB14 TaxID=1447944 RepID=A0A6A4HPS6_9AGAR|nr:hypothetical protein BT96DRAFT_1101665 [Gymnopus androsaceus JB14]
MKKTQSTFRVLFLLILQFGLYTTVNGQIPPDTNLFQWKFSNNFLSTELPSCDTLPVIVSAVNVTNQTHGVPPFYMIAWEIGGTPSSSLLGLDESTTLMLNVVDSQGNGGGIPPQPFTVQPGQTTECVVSGNSTDFTVSANISDTVNTCQPWGIRIQGGIPPYNISLAQSNSPVVTNVTIPNGLTAFTYINRATPGYLLLAAVSDVTGRYAFGTPTVNPTGSDDTSCVGLNSAAGNATLLDQEQAAELEAIAKAKRERSATLAGVLIPLFFLLFGGLAFWGYRYYSTQQRIRKELTPEPLAFPEPKTVEEGSADAGAETRVLSINEFINTRSTSGLNSHLNPFITDAERTASNTSTSRPNSVSSTGATRGFTNFPTASVRHPVSQKAIEAGIVMNRSSPESGHSPSIADAGSGSTDSIDATSQSVRRGAQPICTANSDQTFVVNVKNALQQSPRGEAEYIIQHEDAGSFVRELPPPYAERRSRPDPDVPQSPSVTLISDFVR